LTDHKTGITITKELKISFENGSIDEALNDTFVF